MLNTLDRYILAQIRSPILFSFFVFASLWIVNLLIRLLDLVVSKGVEIEPVFRLLVYSFPTIIVTSIPMSVLMGTMLGISRLNSDSEIIAMKASGVSATRIMRPILISGLGLSLMVYFLNEMVVPRSRFLQEQLYINEITLKKPLPKIASNVFFDGGDQFKLFVRSTNPETGDMHDVTMFQFDGDWPRITEAREARIEDGNLWVFEDGVTTTLQSDGRIVHEIRFDRWDYPISNRYADHVTRKEENRNPKEMTLKELQAEITKRKNSGLSTLEHETHYHWKLAFPMASFFMMLIGAPLSMRHNRSSKGRSNGFGMAILVLLVYYVLLTTGNTLGGNGSLPPLIANWIPNLTCLAFGLYCLKKALN